MYVPNIRYTTKWQIGRLIVKTWTNWMISINIQNQPSSRTGRDSSATPGSFAIISEVALAVDQIQSVARLFTDWAKNWQEKQHQSVEAFQAYVKTHIGEFDVMENDLYRIPVNTKGKTRVSALDSGQRIPNGKNASLSEACRLFRCASKAALSNRKRLKTIMRNAKVDCGLFSPKAIVF